MTGIRTWRRDDGLELIRMESGRLRLDVAPGLGGRIVSLVYRRTGYEHLRDEGIDELIQSLLPEGAGPSSWLQHGDGELGTLALEARVEGISVLLRGALPICGLHYERRISVDEASPQVHVSYHVSNPTGHPIDFFWALRAALGVEQGDPLLCPARKALATDPRHGGALGPPGPAWPGEPSEVALPLGQGVDSLCLGDLQDGWLRVVGAAQAREFGYSFDPAVFPHVWCSASSNSPADDFTAVVGPSTAMPASLAQAAQQGAAARLDPGRDMRTRVVIYAGPPRKSARDIAY